MSDNNIDNLILEHLKRFQAGQERVVIELKEIKSRLSQLEISVAGIRGDMLMCRVTKPASRLLSTDWRNASNVSNGGSNSPEPPQ